MPRWNKYTLMKKEKGKKNIADLLCTLNAAANKVAQLEFLLSLEKMDFQDTRT